MQQRFIRIAQLASAPGRDGLLPVSAPTIWRWVRTGQFPAPVRLGPQVTAWTMEAIEKFLLSREAAGGKPPRLERDTALIRSPEEPRQA